jgi:hypothetical protein
LRWLALCWLCAFGLLHGATARAQGLTPEVSRGLAWLQGQIQADGSLANEASSVATGLQSRTEAAQTFKLLSAIPVSLTDAIAGETDDNTEYLARRIVSIALAGRDPSTLLAALAARQNADGGFGGGPAFDSNALDTAWALIALRSSASLGAVPQALGYLGLAQAFDGSYSAPGRPDIETTAVAVLALRLYASQFNSFAAIARAVPYLLAQQSPVQQWGNSAFLTATAYAAIHDFVPLEPAATAVRGFLTARQGPEGSWDNGDPFSTALALRALVLSATAPANPTLGIARGRVIDSQTRLGLDGVTVTLSGPSNPVPATTSVGSFEFRDLIPGTYTLQLSLGQYGTVSFGTNLAPGQTVDFGAIALTKNTNATTGTVRGSITDATTGLPLAGVSVSLSSGVSATTDAGGNYQISNVAPGNLIIVASKSGYASASGSGSVLAGATLIFGAGLVPSTQGATALEGTVTDGITHAPLQGATVSVTGSTTATATTDSLGHYRIEPLNLGVITVSAFRTGYRSVTATATVVQNTTIQFSPALSATGAVKFFVVSGPVVDSPNVMYRYAMAGPADVPALDLTLTDPSLDRPCCLAFSDSGEMLVVNRGPQTSTISGSISRFSNPQGTPAFRGTITSNSFSAPHFAAFRQGELFVAQRFGNNVLRFTFDAAGNATLSGTISAGLFGTGPRGVAVNPSTGELFVTQCCGVDRINRFVFDANGNASPNGIIPTAPGSSPHDLVFSPWGELFVTNGGIGKVARFVFDAAGNAIPNGEILEAAGGLDFSPWGELFATSGNGFSRWVFDAAHNATLNGRISTPLPVFGIRFLPGVTSSIRGVVVDASSDQALAGVAVTASVAGTTRTFTTTGDGRFEFRGLPAGQAQLSFALTGYVGQSLGLQSSSLTDLDIGAVRLRKTSTAVLLPDLVVQSVDGRQAPSDPQTLAVSGVLAATVVNKGTAATTGGFKTIAFYDVNRNNAYDAGVDLLLGEAQTTQTLEVNATAQVSIPVAGTLPFRDAPIHVWADSDQTVVELNEGNNVASSAQVFEIKPAIGTVLPVVKWEWTGSPVMPAYFRVMMTPVVAPLYDTNGDGKIDSNDAPAIAFVAYGQRDGDFQPGILRVIDGRDRSDILAVSDLNFQLASYSNLAIGDLDGDGIPEIVGVLFGGGLVAFNRDGSVKWVNNDPSLTVGWTFGGPSIADLDGDGKAEVIYGKTVVNHDGTTRWVGSGGFAGGNHALGPLDKFSVVADINLDGHPHVIAGGSAFDRNGALVWQNNAVGDGLVAVGNFNSDPYPEIVVVSAGRVFLLDRFGQIIWGPVAIPGGGRGGPPTIADVDGDGIPEIGVAGATRYSVFRADGSLLWSVPSQDQSQVTGSTVFDFDGDGKAEVIYNDEKLLRIFNGATGAVIFSIVNPSGTASEYPVVVDLDGDGHADLLAVRNDFWEPSPSGIRAFRDANNSWVSARAMWNQHTYHVTNVNDDGSIPRVEQNSWQAHNTYRANVGRRLFSCVPPGEQGEISLASGPGWDTYTADPVGPNGGASGAAFLGQSQAVCLNAASPANCPASALRFGFPGGGWGANLSSIPGSVWISGPGISPSSLADLERFAFSRTFSLGAAPRGTLSVSADDFAEVRVNGVSVGTVGSITNVGAASAAQSALTTFNLTPFLHEGSNTITIVSQNGPASFAGCAPPCNHSQNPTGVVFGGTLSSGASVDLTASLLKLVDLGSGQLRLSVRVGNGGAAATPGSSVSFFNGDPAHGGALFGSAPVRALPPGQFQDVSLSGTLGITGQSDIFAFVDPANQIAECRETNNTASTPARPTLSGGIAVATDASTYGARAPVRVSAAVVNTSPLPATYTVKIHIEDGKGALVATFPPRAGVTLAAGANTIVSEIWNTGSTLAGAYQAKAELLDNVGQPYASATAPFSIGAGAVTVSAKVSADKVTYQPSETVQITSRLANLTENQTLDSLTAVTTVSNPDGTPHFTRSEPIAQLPQSALRDFNYALPLGFASPGTYNVALNLRDALGALLASSSTSFTVASSAVGGSGLTGSVSATPKPVPFGDPIAFNAAVTNRGNADIPALAVKLTIVDPVTASVLAEFPATVALAQAQSAPLSFAWPANAAVGGTYVAVLSATTGTATVTLAQDAFTIAPPVTRVAGTLTAAPKQVSQGASVSLAANVSNVGFGAIAGLPISVTVVNSATQQVVAQFSDTLAIGLHQSAQRTFTWPATGAVGTSFTAALTATINGVARTLAQDSLSIIAPPVQLDVALTNLKQARVLVLLSCKYADNDSDGDHDTEQGDPAKQACVTQKSAFLASYLTGLGITNRITTTTDDFTRALRSGQYNTYWITGGALKLDNDLAEEVREAVFRGDALILDAVHDERNHGLDAVAGTDVHGKLGVTGPTINVNGPIFAPGTLASSGRPLQLDLTTGVAQAVFAASPSRPAIVTNQYGLGRGVLFAYNLVATLMTQPSSALDNLVSAAIGWVAPAPAAVSEARAYTVLRARVTNVGIAADLKATFTPPAGATVLGTVPAATPDASGRPVWTFTLDSGATKNLDVGLRLPANTGSFTANISIDSARNDLATPFSKFVTLSVESADTVAPRVAGELSALTVSSNDKSDRDHAISSIRAAQASLASGQSERAIDQLIEASERLLKITSADVSAQRVQVDRLLQEAEVRWFIAQP